MAKNDLRTKISLLGIGFLVITGLGVAPQIGSAFTFNKNYLLSNRDFTDSSAMSVSRIDSYLRASNGVLQSISDDDESGVIKSASQLIAEASVRYALSPKFFLALIEKESGLVKSRQTATPDLIDFALGYGCPDGSGCNEQYRGFSRQVDAAGNRIRNGYLADLATRGVTISGWGVGLTKRTSDGIYVTPQNEATASLYTYNPWVGAYGGGDQRWGGNSLFAKIWQEWFTLIYPDGSLLRVTGENGVWLIRQGQRHPFHSRAAFMSAFDMSHVTDVDRFELEAYPLGTPIKYPEFSLLQAPSGGVYLLANGLKRPIMSRETFRQLGFNPEELIRVSWDELNLYPDGDKIDESSVYPTGTLLQSRESGGIYYIENGVRHSIWSKEILQNRYKYRKWTVASQADIDNYAAGEPVKFKDGEIVTSPNAGGVYLISNGAKRPIPSIGILNQLGLKWSNLIRTTDAALNIHPTGERIDFTPS